MNNLNLKLNTSLATVCLAATLMAQAPVFASEAEKAAEAKEAATAAQQAEMEQIQARREEMLQAIEKSRLEAARAAEEARVTAERLREETEQLRAETEEKMLESGARREEQMREMERARRELSRTHRELRRASQEVARAHRDLALTEDKGIRTRLINLGDRAMIGVILGKTTDEGVEIIGLSPDGPAERAGIETGDVLVSLRGESLAADSGRDPRATVYDVMSEVEDGEEIAVTVLRNGKRWDYMVTPDTREPASWASYIRLPDAPEIVVSPDAPDAPSATDHVLIERIAVPPIDTVAIADEVEALSEELESFRAVIADSDVSSYSFQYDVDDLDFDTESLSDVEDLAFGYVTAGFGNPATRGIRFVELNEGLGSYFDSDRGVLVLDAPEDNALGLKAGDVVLKIGEDDVNETSDIVRALRDYDSGDSVRIAIKRNKRDESLEALIPEDRIGMIHQDLFKVFAHPDSESEIAAD